MRINVDQLDSHLQRTLQGFYWIAGDETLLVQEALSALRANGRTQGFTEWELFFVDRGFSWQTMLQSGNSLSLFADRKIIELRLSSKLEDAGRDALSQYLASPNPDNLLILVTPKLESATLSTKWFKALESAGVFVQVWPVDARGLPRWISARMARLGLSADSDAISLLCERVEGNLLAADQEIQKLGVLMGATPTRKVHVDRRQIMTLVADSSRYNVFTLLDAALLGDSRRCLKVLGGLQAEGSEVLALLAMLARELRTLIAIRRRIASGSSGAAAMSAEGVRKTHEAPVAAALERLSLPDLEGLLQQARQVDLAVKGMSAADAWTELTDILLALSGTPLVTAARGQR
jgi:DNA polymerase-3 subunit delta